MNLLVSETVRRSFRALGWMLVFTPACVTPREGTTRSPRDALVAVQHAAARGDWTTLYAALPVSARGAEPLDAFRARMDASRPEVNDLAHRMGDAIQENESVVVEVPGRAGSGTTLVDEGNEWRMLDHGFGVAPARTPAAAIRQFRSALQRGGFESLLGALSARARGGIRAEIAGLIDATSAPDTLPIQISPNNPGSADVTLPDGRHLRLMRDGANWRVDDLP